MATTIAGRADSLESIRVSEAMHRGIVHHLIVLDRRGARPVGIVATLDIAEAVS